MKKCKLFFLFFAIYCNGQNSKNNFLGLRYADINKLSNVPYVLPPKVPKGGEKEKKSIDLSKDFPPIGSQGSVGACSSWASVYGVRSYIQKKKENYSYKTNNILDKSKVLSPMFVYNIVKPEDQRCDTAGSYIKDNLEFMKDFGVCKKSSYDPMPYDYSICSDYPFNNMQLRNEAKNYRISNYGWFIRYGESYYPGYKLSKFKDFLAKGYPVIIGADIDSLFWKTGGTKRDTCIIWDRYNGIKSGEHAMVCVGYNNDLKAIKVYNSWDIGWGNKGYGWISYSLIDEFVFEAYVMETTGLSNTSTKNISYVPKTRQSLSNISTNSFWEGEDTNTFFIKNRYQPYNDIRIMPVEISKKNQSAILKVYQLIGKEVKEVDVFELGVGEKYEFIVNEIVYEFEFKTIKRYWLLGSNAVYYNLTWKKTTT